MMLIIWIISGIISSGFLNNKDQIIFGEVQGFYAALYTLCFDICISIATGFVGLVIVICGGLMRDYNWSWNIIYKRENI